MILLMTDLQYSNIQFSKLTSNKIKEAVWLIQRFDHNSLLTKKRLTKL